MAFLNRFTQVSAITAGFRLPARLSGFIRQRRLALFSGRFPVALLIQGHCVVVMIDRVLRYLETNDRKLSIALSVRFFFR